MWHVPSELHKSSLQLMHRLMHCLFILPPRHSQFCIKIFYNIVLLIYISLMFRWRYSLIKDYVLHDGVSRLVDSFEVCLIIFGHLIVAMELLWRNQSSQIEHQFQEMRELLFVQFRHKVNLKRIERYSNVIYQFVFVRVAILLFMTIYISLAWDNFFLAYSTYAEIVFTLRCCEFSLHTALVMAFFYELNDAAHKILKTGIVRLNLCSDYCLTVERLAALQQLHLMLWNAQRDIEQNFVRSLLVVMMKNFVDSSVIPYWMFLNAITNRNISGLQIYGLTEELGKLLEILIPCWICTRCDRLQRQFRTIFHGISTARHNNRLNFALLSISAQLGQERSKLIIGGFLPINLGLLGKLLFGMLSYFIICIQLQPTFIDSFEKEASLSDITTTKFPNLTEEYNI